jgi:3-methyl-2-oxobutanoate hydroxymethyltransferase
MQSAITTSKLIKMKEDGEKITALTAYDCLFAHMVDKAGVEMILVGDSLGMVVQGKATTLPVTMDEMIYHTEIVARACEYAMVIGDMPFMSYQGSIDEALRNAGRFLKETNAAAVKLEGGVDVADIIEKLVKSGIPVQAHIGLTPQSVHQMGGFKVQRDEDRLLDDAKRIEDAGAFSVVLEGIPSAISEKITAQLSIPTIGIGAGLECDGQILVLPDMLGISDRKVPKFVKKYADLNTEITNSLEKYVKEVKGKSFPSKEYEYK